MAMTIKTITAVSPENSYLLLTEKTFDIVGREYELLTESELANRRIQRIPGISYDDQLSEGTKIGRPVADMVRLVANDVNFHLSNYRDAKLIFTIIDHFLISQAKLLPERLRGIGQDMLEDFANLTTLANIMLRYIDVGDRIDLMNAPKEAVETYESIFDLDITSASSSAISITASSTYKENEGYRSPFSDLIVSRGLGNRVNRFGD